MRTELPTQVLAGGRLQVLPAHGLPTHAALAQPLGQGTFTVVYEQVPFEHVPDDAYTFSVCASAQVLGGGRSHTTPAHGSFSQAPLVQREVHVADDCSN